MDFLKSCDSIEKLLETTGWSCDDLLSRLQQYKTAKETNASKEVAGVECNISIDASEQENQHNKKVEDDTSVTLDTNITLPDSDCEKEESSQKEDVKDTSENLQNDGECISTRTDTDFTNGSENDVCNSKSSETPPIEEVLINDKVESCAQPKCPQEKYLPEYSRCEETKVSAVCNNDDSLNAEQESPVCKPVELDKSEEDLRSILKMQLSSLRNKRKSGEYLSDFQKKPAVSFHSLKKKRRSIPLLSTSSSAHLDNENFDKNIEQNDDSLISLSDETQFLIMDVTGGVDRVVSSNEQSVPNIKVKSIEDLTDKRRFSSISSEEKENQLCFDSREITNRDQEMYKDKAISKKNRNDSNSVYSKNAIGENLITSLCKIDEGYHSPNRKPIDDSTSLLVDKEAEEIIEISPSEENKSDEKDQGLKKSRSLLINSSLSDLLNKNSGLSKNNTTQNSEESVTTEDRLSRDKVMESLTLTNLLDHFSNENSQCSNFNDNTSLSWDRDTNESTSTKCKQNEDLFKGVSSELNKSVEASVSSQVKTKQDKSPFVSDSLEYFLNEGSRLNISYKIPKLGAEEGINESTKKSPFENLTQKAVKLSGIKEHHPPPAENTKLIKAKTLAEMRRQIENIRLKKGQEVLPSTMKIKGVDAVTVTSLPLQVKNDDAVNSSMPRNSYVIYNKKRLWLPAKYENVCIARIDKSAKDNVEVKKEETTPEASTEQVSSRRPSLLSTLSMTSKPCKVKYKPGPLSKKVQLQSKESTVDWKTEIKSLPKVYLEVCPEINKPISPNVRHLLPVFDDVTITEERANFALSVIKSKDSNSDSKLFKFPVRYKNNQEKIVVRKHCSKATEESLINNQVANDPETDIKNVIDDMIKYVEIKEIENTLIKEDDTLFEVESDNTLENSGQVKMSKCVRKIKRKKIDLELLRLNCKVINVQTDSTDDETCSKLHCKMGCVCKSLACESIFSNHCGRIGCMFECSCIPTENNEMRSLNNSLSEFTVNHLDDQAKRNMAKVEREFTQTIIHTGNDTILVGSGGRSKMRRTSKAPKKYKDYIGNIDEIFEMPRRNSVEESPPKFRKCTVDLVNLNLEDVVPFCLVHRCYSCFCKGKIINAPQELNVVEAKEHKPEITKKSELRMLKSLNSCARSRQIFSEYIKRNKDPLYNARLRKERTCVSVSINDSSDVEIVEEDTDDSRTDAASQKKVHKRKQLLEVRHDPDTTCDKEYAMQRRKKSKPNGSISSITTSTSKYEPVFEGEIKVSLRDNLEMLKIIGEKNAHLEYLRILPWSILVKSFNNRSINIWCMNKRPTVLLCNKGDKHPPKNFTDVRNVSHTSEIIDWIINNSLPADKPEKLMHVVLTPTKNHFLISGFCLKNITSSNLTSSVQPAENAEQTVANTKAILLPPNRSLKCTHKDMNDDMKTLILTNKQFENRIFSEKPSKPSPQLGETTLSAPLPKIPKLCKWRMIYLNSDFSFLCFVSSKYSIKYTDLMDVVNMSKNINRTITLRNKQFTECYKHPIFGIFCVPSHQDRLFIGPFMHYEDHKIVTLRYMHGSLIDTCVFNEIQGKNNTKVPTWLREAEINFTSICADILIDITKDDEDEDKKNNSSGKKIIVIGNKDTSPSPEKAEIDRPSSNSDENLFCAPFVTVLNADDLKGRKVNRYIVTNIPHLGYLEAYQHQLKIIDVFWPGGNIGYRFPNVNFATESLIQYFSQIYCTIPKHFKINVVIMTQLDLQRNIPIEPKYVSNSEPYVCGEFGIFKEKDIPPSLLLRHRVPSIKSLLTCTKRKEKNINRLIHLFGMFLMSNDELNRHSEPNDILQWAISEIYVLRKLGANYESEKTDLQRMARSNLRKLKEHRSSMPANKRKKIHDKPTGVKPLKNKLSISAATMHPPDNKRIEELEVTETIEIKDSDEEEDPQIVQTSTVSEPVFPRVSTGGTIHSNDERSLLKRKFVPQAGQSLLKSPKLNREEFKVLQDKTKSEKSIKIYPNLKFNSNQIVITKTKPDLLFRKILPKMTK